jgi:hypothetical protein
MPDLDAATLNERLDERGYHGAVRGPGCYGLELSVPDDEGRVRARWPWTEGLLGAVETLAAAQRVAYVGASGNVRDRLAEHVAGDTRSTRMLDAYPPTDIVAVWPREDPFERERRCARRLARDGWVVWCDGEVVVG